MNMVDLQATANGVETLRIDQVRKIKDAERADQARKAEIDFEFTNGAGLHGYLVDLEDSLRYSALSMYKNPVRDYLLSARIIKQLQTSLFANDALLTAPDRKLFASLTAKLSSLQQSSEAGMDSQQLQAARECEDSITLIPILRHVAVNSTRREELEVVKKLYNQSVLNFWISIWKNTALIVFTIIFLMFIYYIFSRFLLPVGFFNLYNLTVFGLLIGIWVVSFMVLRFDLQRVPRDLKAQYLDLRQENWFSLTSAEILIAKKYNNKNSLEIQELIQSKIDEVTAILGDDWEKNYTGEFILMY
jgi:hypothetical protein